MIDFHTHTFLSDGELIPSELAARAASKGYKAIAITDHVDSSNIAEVIGKTLEFVASVGDAYGLKIIPGVELTHVVPSKIGALTEKARTLGARLIVCHGETVIEPVSKGTNMAAIEAGVDILAHPGLIENDAAKAAAEKGVYLEITARRGHSITNGHVANAARKHGARLVINTDAHAPGDLITIDEARVVALGAAMTEGEFKDANENAKALLKKTLG